MRFFLVTFLLSPQVYAMDFNKVTGTFEAQVERTPSSESGDSFDGTFTPKENHEESNRQPASLNATHSDQSESLHVNELTGTFK